MIKISNVEVFNMEAAIRGMRNPMNSWDKSDSYATHIEKPSTLNTAKFEYFVGDDDLALMKRLAGQGPVHGKFMRMIQVSMDILAPLYWWKEFDTYKVGTVANSCSTMHKIHAKEFALDDFSHEHVKDYDGFRRSNGTIAAWFESSLWSTIDTLNDARRLYLQTNDKQYWWQMIQLLPSSYNQLRTVAANYEVLRNMYTYRNNHKLDEWREFCGFVETLPYSELITGKELKEDGNKTDGNT